MGGAESSGSEITMNAEFVELSKLVLSLLTEGVKLLSDAHEGKINPTEAAEKVKSLKAALHDRLTTVNEKISKEISEKFDKSEP
jgi:hypothetical protein